MSSRSFHCASVAHALSVWGSIEHPLVVSYNVVMTHTNSGDDSTSSPTDISPDWLAEFEAAARRPLRTRFRYAFIRTYKPVMDDETFRAFDTTADYRRWCEENLPDWLGYGRV